jgi:hypothetical protein
LSALLISFSLTESANTAIGLQVAPTLEPEINPPGAAIVGVLPHAARVRLIGGASFAWRNERIRSAGQVAKV